MEKLKSSLAAKIIASILFLAFLVSFAVSLAGIAAMDAGGIYQSKKEELLKEQFRFVCDKYSVVALSGYQEDFSRQELSDTNFKYGVIKANTYDAESLRNMDNYIVKNFGKLPDMDSLNIFEADINQDTRFTVGKNIWDACYLSHGPNVDYISKQYPIDGWYYDMRTESLYIRSGEALYPVEKIGWVYPKDSSQGNGIDLTELNNSCLDVETDAGGAQITYQWRDAYGQISVNTGSDSEIFLQMHEIQIAEPGKLEKLGEISDEYVSHFDSYAIYTEKEVPVKKEHYIVVSYMQEPLQGNQPFVESDMFMQTKRFTDFAYRMRYPAIVILILSFLGLFMAFSFLMASAGHRKCEEGISKRFLDKIPLDLHFGCAFGAEIALAGIICLFAESTGGWSLSPSSGVVTFSAVSACMVVAGVFIFLAFCMSFAVSVKLGKWWRNTIIYWVWNKFIKLLRKCISMCSNAINGLFRSMTLLWKAWIILGLLALMEYIGIASAYGYYSYGKLLTLWMLEKIILYPVIILFLLQMHKLQKGAQRIANGELNFQVDTSHMFWEVKKHGEYLNDIRNGMNFAVNERLKSERFKTELITNVSHDIKTPLTSIINYVDLLEKEQIENTAVQEYLEVLHRQSARLKKLIEDLMEASKASTGNLSVVMEKCDAGVMLVQTVGEFEEKLMENQIELQIKKPEESIFIDADNRHLWRVFDNLMNNICKYAQPMTRAYVNLDKDGTKAAITFRNISKCQLNISSEELMERFVRGDSSRNTEGSGLGISIAKSLTELMDGKFDLIVDGDLFKVVLSFPLYGAPIQCNDKEQKEPSEAADGRKKPQPLAEIASGLQTVGAHAAGIGQDAVHKTGRIFQRAGRFAYHVRQAAQQVKDEEEKKGMAADDNPAKRL